MRIQNLDGRWKLEGKNFEEPLAISIPGSVLAALIENKKIKHPYERDYEYEAREWFREDYILSRKFEIDKEFLEEEYIELVCLGIDTLARVYLNDQFLFYANNMHRTWKIPCKSYLKPGTNKIRVILESPIAYIENYKTEEGKEINYVPCGAMKGNQFIRKAHSMFGWDWGAQLPDAGIWRDITLRAYSKNCIEEVLTRQDHKKEGVELQIRTRLKQALDISCHLVYELKGPDGKILKNIQVSHEKMEKEYTIKMLIENPELWWPNDYGSQPLYSLKVILYTGEERLDEKKYTIGLRTLTISQEKDEWGNEFTFIVNGLKIFTRGANYIPEDCVYSWITPQRVDYLLKSAVKSHFNCIRVWGGGYYPTDEFYNLCDQYGLIVWQDFMYACNIYEFTASFEENIIAEAKDNIIRLRHHPSLGLFCGNNEIESAWDHWGGFCEHSKRLKADYIKQFEYLLPRLVQENAPDTFYWPSSPSSGGCFEDPDSQNRGDTHYWDVWHGQKPFSDYQKHFFRFCSEFGFQSFPSIKTIKTFTEEEDRNIFSKVMESHQKNEAANGKMLYYLSETFKYPKDFESLIYLTQVLQGMAIKSGVDHWRRNRGRCMGTLYWQLNDNWPVASWSSIDYYGRWKPLQYMAAKFYAPTTGSIVRNDKTISAYIHNETRREKEFEVSFNLRKLDFSVITQQNFRISVPAFSSMKVGEVDYSLFINNIEDEVFVEVVFIGEEETFCENEIFVPYKYLKLPEPHITYKVLENDTEYIVKLKAACYAPYIEIDLKQADAIFEDNYFTITNAHEKEIKLEKKNIRWLGQEKRLLEEITIRSIRDTF